MTLEEELAIVQSYIRLFNSDDGKQILSDLQRECYIDQLSFVPGDQHITSFHEGKRSIFLYLSRKLNPEMYKQLEKQVEQLKGAANARPNTSRTKSST